MISFSGYFQTSPIQYRTDMESVPHIKLANTVYSKKKATTVLCRSSFFRINGVQSADPRY
ncbi:hypothetical protein EGW65_11445 [Enterococcus faecium]|nr:hypothetical protein EGW41_11445 [Enterococcus faecium]ROY27288.1 hypothetical protein EGW52_11595 [Enterococcus faecium]ROY39192.1 hypothetical protein EGW51_11600 [Enterococcus faecium]ROY47256.1 hypothetical protein EGW75_11675 [Enterococcus faecium]ROY61329.1 hypothetical protein EGW65_11445 [Enterococcus faecium]